MRASEDTAARPQEEKKAMSEAMRKALQVERDAKKNKDRILEVLGAGDPRGMRAGQIGKEIGRESKDVTEILKSLRYQGLVECDTITKRWLAKT